MLNRRVLPVAIIFVPGLMVAFGVNYIFGGIDPATSLPWYLAWATPYVPEIFWACVVATCIVAISALVRYQTDPAALLCLAGVSVSLVIIVIAMGTGVPQSYRSTQHWAIGTLVLSIAVLVIAALIPRSEKA